MPAHPGSPGGWSLPHQPQRCSITKPQTLLQQARQDAQNLHRKISAHIGDAEHATWADVKAVQTDVNALGVKMNALAADQAEAAKAGIRAAIIRLELAGKIVQDTSVAAKDGVSHANAALLESAHRAAQSLSAAVAAGRTQLAHAIEPKKVVA